MWAYVDLEDGGGGGLELNYAQMCVEKVNDMGPFSDASQFN